MNLRQRLINLWFSLLRFPGSGRYWELRYRLGGTSGAGSYGAEAEYKAAFLNAFFQDNAISEVIDFGCGDGNQAAQLELDSYLGFDVSEAAVAKCRERFAGRAGRRFAHISEYRGESIQCAMSLDVLYHIVEQDEFEAYLRRLFSAGRDWVIVYAADVDEVQTPRGRHVYRRRFTPWVDTQAPGFSLVASPPRPKSLSTTAAGGASFFVWRRRSGAPGV